MRKLVVGFVIASVGLAVPGTWVDAAQGLKGGPSKQVRGGKVTYTVTTSCRRVYLRSNPGGSRTALVPATRLVSGGSVTISRNVRSKAAFKKFSVVAYCNGKRGKKLGTVKLTVRQRLAHTGLPILPQVLLAAGLLGTGGVLLLAGRRRRLGAVGGHAPGYQAGTPGGRRA
jgi:hypothetical protein